MALGDWAVVDQLTMTDGAMSSFRSSWTHPGCLFLFLFNFLIFLVWFGTFSGRLTC